KRKPRLLFWGEAGKRKRGQCQAKKKSRNEGEGDGHELPKYDQFSTGLLGAGEQDRGDHLERNRNAPPKYRSVPKFTGADFRNRELTLLKLLLHGVDEGGVAANFPFQQNQARIQDKRQVHDN